jgi:hypothetical protein
MGERLGGPNKYQILFNGHKNMFQKHDANVSDNTKEYGSILN